jgi:hypothetical protein
VSASADPTNGHPPATLTDWLRSRQDSELAALLHRRPDLALPAPADLPALAGRLTVRTSVQRALDGLDTLALRTLEALVLVARPDGRTSAAEAIRLLGPLDDLPRQAVTELCELALVWGDGDTLHLVTGVGEALGPYPAGLGRPATQLGTDPETVAALSDPGRLAELLAACDADERTVLDRLAEGPPVGTVRDTRIVTVRSENLPAALRLLARGLLAPVDTRTVELPREIGIALRERPIGPLQPEAPAIDVEVRPPEELDRAGGTTVLEALRLVETLCESWAAHPAAQLRAGGVGVRDLRRTARDLGVDEPTAAVVIETAAAAGLINATHELESMYLPTPEYDTWLQHEPPQRWTALARAWLDMTRQPSLTSQRGERDRVISVLGPDAERGTLPALRGQVLDLLASLPPGGVPRDRSAVLAHLAWQAPRRAGSRAGLIDAILTEADLLGLSVGSGLTGYSRTLLDGSRAVAEQVLGDALPAPVDHFLVQPDLTLVVPGPPEPGLARDLALVADLESSGGASVYRITEATVRRALDSGRTASSLHAFLVGCSRTPIPQALTYLVDDAARRHGALRTGTASAYLRSDDVALLDRVVADRAVQPLQLRRLADTVAISSAPVAQVLHVLRAAGYAPAAEAPDGGVIALESEVARAPSRPPERPARMRTAVASEQQLGELVRRIRAGDALSTISTRVQPISQQIPGVTSAATMAVLREAIRNGQRVLLDCVESDGTSGRHEILPISMAGGTVRGHEPETSRLASFPLHRLTRVSVIEEADDST